MSGSRRAVMRTLQAVLAVDAATYGVVVPFLPGHAARLGLGEAATGALFAAYAVTCLVVSLAMGAVAHRLNAKRALAVGVALIAVSNVMFVVWSDSVVGLFAARGMQGVAAAVAWVIAPAALAELYPDQERGKTMGGLVAVSSMGTLMGPPLGGVLYEWGGFALPFAALAGVAGLLGLAVAWVMPATPRPSPETTAHESPAELFRVLRLPGILPVGAVVLFVTSVLGMLEPTLPLELFRRFGATELETGLVFALLVGVYGVTAAVAGARSDQVGRRTVLTAGLVAVALLLPWVAQVPSFMGTVAMVGAVAAAMAVAFAPTLPALADALDRARDGEASEADYLRVYTLYSSMWTAGLLVGPLVGSALSELWGLAWALAAVSVLALPVLWVMRRRVPD